jgi:hypothetical protein
MKFFIPGNVPSSKNGRRWTGKYFIASKTVVNYRKIAKPFYISQANAFKKELAKHSLPVEISFTFIRGTKHKFDYINPAQTVQDDMVTHGWIEDDNVEFIKPVFMDYQYDKANPGVIIEIISNAKINTRNVTPFSKNKRQGSTRNKS